MLELLLYSAGAVVLVLAATAYHMRRAPEETAQLKQMRFALLFLIAGGLLLGFSGWLVSKSH